MQDPRKRKEGLPKALTGLRFRRLAQSLLLIAVVCSAAFFPIEPDITAGGRSSRPGRLPREVRQALQPGVVATFRTLSDDKMNADVRVDRLPALYVAENSSPTPFLPPGPFQVTWSGWLKVRLRGECRFQLQGRGKAVLLLNGRPILTAGPGELSPSGWASANLAKGYNALRIEYSSPPSGEAFLRAYWSGEDFGKEPLPITRLFHDSRQRSVREGRQLRQGRFHLANFGCLKCHSLGTADLPVAQGMPEFSRDAPNLAQAGRRLKKDWVARWLLDPQSLRSEPLMPQLLHHLKQPQAEQTAADLAAYVASLDAAKNQMPGRPTGSGKETLEREGQHLYEFRGCIACHRFTPPGQTDEFSRVSLRFVDHKYQPGALQRFLQNTHAHYRWIRMPRFRLSDQEAQALAAWLRHRSSEAPPDNSPESTHQSPETIPPGDGQRGRVAFGELGCVNCHQVSRSPGAPSDPAKMGRLPLAVGEVAAARGCLASSSSARGHAPLFSFIQSQDEAILTFLQNQQSFCEDACKRQVPAEFAQRQIRRLKCVACHTRDAIKARLPLLGAEEGSGKHHDAVPQLTWVGEKLHPAWSQNLLAGTLQYRVREHFRTRMPAFPKQASLLAVGMSHQHGFAGSDHPPRTQVQYDHKLAQVGEKIAGLNGGLACARCHGIGPNPPLAPDQAVSTNLSYARERLRYHYYRRWMLDPLRVEPGTRMLKLAPDGKTTPLTRYFGGVATKQFDAIWQYLGALDHQRRQQRSEHQKTSRNKRTSQGHQAGRGK